MLVNVLTDVNQIELPVKCY